MMKFIRKIVLMGFVLFAPLFAFAQAIDPSGECFNGLENNPELQAIKGKVALGTIDGQTLEMLASDKRPNSVEKNAISKWDTLRQPCNKVSQDWWNSRVPQNVAVIISKVQSEFKSLLADLYAGRITYGQFAKNRLAISEKAKVEAVNANQQNQMAQNQQAQIDRQNAQAEAQIQEQKRQAAINAYTQLQHASAAQQQANAASQAATAAQQAAMRQNLPTYQPPPAVNPYQFGTGTPSAPQNTNCRMIGNTMNCTSY